MATRPSAENAFAELIVRGGRDLSGRPGARACDDGFPRSLRPLVFALLWLAVAALLLGLAVVWLRYPAGAG